MAYDFSTGKRRAAPSTEGDFSRGLKQSFQQLKGTGYGLLGLAGAGANIQGLKDYGLENAAEAFAKSDAMGKPYDQLEGIESFGDGVDWLQHGLGYVAGQAVPSLVSGGVGALAGRYAVKKGVQAATKDQIQRGIRTGAIAGSGIASYGQEAGSIYPEMVQEGHDEPGRAALYALPAAALDLLPEAMLATKLFPLGNMLHPTKGIIRRTLTEGAKQGAVESITEGFQTAIERDAAYKSLNDKEAWSDYINSAALGFLGGGVGGGIVGALNPGTSVLPTGNPGPMQQELPLGPGGGAAPNITADTLDVGPQFQEQTTVDQPDLLSQQFQFDKGLAPTAAQQVSPIQASDQIAQGLPTPTMGPPTPQVILPGQAEPPPRPEAAAAPQIIIPDQPTPSNKPIIAPQKTPDTRTAYGLAAQKQQRGQLLTPYETYLVNNPPETPQLEIAKDNSVPRPSQVAERTEAAVKDRGYKMTEKRRVVAMAAEEAYMAGTLDEGSYDQIHTLLAESKLAKASSVLLQSNKPKETKNVQEQKTSPTQVAPAKREEVPTTAAAPVQEVGRKDARLLEPKKEPPVEPSIPVVVKKPKAVKKPEPKLDEPPKVNKAMAKEVYEDNHQKGEPTYDELSKEDQAIWDDKVAYGEGTTPEYDKFQRQLRNNAVKDKRAKAKPVDEADVDLPSPKITGTIRKGADILKKAPPTVLNKIKVKTESSETAVPIKEALQSIDDEIAGLKTILKCVG